MNHLKQIQGQKRRQLRLEYLPAFIALLETIVGVEVGTARQVFDGTKKTLLDWIEVFYPILNDRIARDALPVVRGYGDEVADAALAEIDALDIRFDRDSLSLDYAEKLADRWTNASIAQLTAIARDEDDETFEDVFVERMDSWEESRAKSAGEREATQAGAAFTKIPFIVAGVERMVWLAGADACPLCQKLHGKTVSITAPFVGKGETVDPEDGETTPMVTQQVIGHPPLHGMGGKGGVCDCIVAAV